MLYLVELVIMPCLMNNSSYIATTALYIGVSCVERYTGCLLFQGCIGKPI